MFVLAHMQAIMHKIQILDVSRGESLTANKFVKQVCSQAAVSKFRLKMIELIHNLVSENTIKYALNQPKETWKQILVKGGISEHQHFDPDLRSSNTKLLEILGEQATKVKKASGRGGKSGQGKHH